MQSLVEVKGIALELLYATPLNFTGEAVYPKSALCYLQKRCRERLYRVQKGLQKKGLALKVFDGYRPLSVQKKFWKLIPDPRYVADPLEGSKHNRGAAVDVTLIDKAVRELPMPTPFDDFTEKAHRDYRDLPPQVIQNRETLERAMVAEGFIPFPTEWWHYDDPEWESYPVMDVSFEELAR
jgi:D-alanyl-D-alanine dipeptidase